MFDPYFTKKEIYDATKVKTFSFPKDLPKFDCLIISVDHKQFKIPKKILEKYLKNCKLIIDHDGAWKKYNLKIIIIYLETMDGFNKKGIDRQVKGSKSVITGGAGFIGSNLADHLVKLVIK